MPRAPFRPCRKPACPALVSAAGGGYCDQHLAELRGRLRDQGRLADQRRPDRRARGYDERWKESRRAYLMRHPLCADCASRNVVAAATQVDHIVAHRGDMALFWNEDNWQPLCASCHSTKTNREQSGAHRPPDMRRALVPLYVVCGPAGAGKSLLVQRNARPGDLVLDIDELVSNLGNLPSHAPAPPEIVRAAMVRRNELLLRLCVAPVPWPAAWLLASFPRASDPTLWRDTAGATVLLLPAPLPVCTQRIDTDSTRNAPAAAAGRAAAAAWWRTYSSDAYNDHVVNDASTYVVQRQP